MNTEKFAQRLQQARESKKLTLKRLKEKTGISMSALSHYSSGINLPPLDIAAKLADALDVSLDWLCSAEPEVKQQKEIFSNCEEVAVFIDMALASFKSASVKCQEDNAIGFHEQCINLQIASRALYRYYRQKEAGESLNQILPTDLQGDFVPYKKAMEQQLREGLRQANYWETGLKQDNHSNEDLPF